MQRYSRTPPKKTRPICLEGQKDAASKVSAQDLTKRAVDTTGGVTNGDVAEVAGTEVAIEEPNDWVLKARKRRKPPRPSAIIIKPTEKFLFADILRKVMNALELNSVGDDIHLVKKTQKGI